MDDSDVRERVARVEELLGAIEGDALALEAVGACIGAIASGEQGRRIPLPIAPLGLGGAGPDVVRYLRYGRGVDTTRMTAELGFVPRRSTIEAIEATAA